MKAYNKHRAANADLDLASDKFKVSTNNTAYIKNTMLKAVQTIVLVLTLSACGGPSSKNNTNTNNNIQEPPKTNKPGAALMDEKADMKDIFNKKYVLLQPMSFADASKENFVFTTNSGEAIDKIRFTYFLQLNKKYSKLSEITSNEPYCEIFIERQVGANDLDIIYPTDHDLKITGHTNKVTNETRKNNAKVAYFFKLVLSFIDSTKTGMLASNAINLQCYDITDSLELKKHIRDYFGIEEVAKDELKDESKIN